MAAPAPEYEPLAPLGGDSLRLRFSGPFAGSITRWDATFQTLDRYRHHHADDTEALRNFIDIGAIGPQGRRLTVILDVPAFDAATVAKAIIMVRNYRRLRIGRHWFGTEKRFDPP